MSWIKEQDKNPQELNEVELRSLPIKRNQSTDSKDDQRAQKKKGHTDWKDTRNVQQRNRQ